MHQTLSSTPDQELQQVQSMTPTHAPDSKGTVSGASDWYTATSKPSTRLEAATVCTSASLSTICATRRQSPLPLAG